MAEGPAAPDERPLANESDRQRSLRELSALYAAGALSADELARAEAALFGGSGHSRSALTGRVGAAFAGAGGLLALIAFSAMPLAAMPFPIGPVTAADVAGLAPDEPPLALLWLVPLAAAAIVAAAARQLLAPAARPGRSLIIVVLGAAVLLTHLIALVVVQHRIRGSLLGQFGVDVVGLAGSGFWAGVIGAAVATIGGSTGLGRTPSRPPVLIAGAALVTMAAVTAGLLVVAPEPAPDLAITSSAGARSVPDFTASPTPPTTPGSPVDSLDQIVATDRGEVASLVGLWVPQLSAKRVGLEADGIVYGYEDIARHHRSITVGYPGALLLASDSYASFRESGYYITVMPIPFATGEEALGWCASQALGPDDCFAKRLQLTGGPDGNTLYQS